MYIPDAGELRKMNGRKCEAVASHWYFLVWEIAVENNKVYILHNNSSANWWYPENMKWYNYGWVIINNHRNNVYISDEIKSIKFLDETIKKPKRKDYTYETQYVRSDWIIFTKDAIDWIKIEDLQEKEKEHIQEARRIRWLLNSHKAKF